LFRIVRDDESDDNIGIDAEHRLAATGSCA
jgi:hypothetical protein